MVLIRFTGKPSFPLYLPSRAVRRFWAKPQFEEQRPTEGRGDTEPAAKYRAQPLGVSDSTCGCRQGYTQSAILAETDCYEDNFDASSSGAASKDFVTPFDLVATMICRLRPNKGVKGGACLSIITHTFSTLPRITILGTITW